MTTAVRADVFPAELVADPDAPDPADRRRVYPVRVVVTMDEVLVFRDSGARRGLPELVFRDRLASYSPPVPATRATKEERAAGAHRWAVLTTDTGHALSFARASGCGCGSKLKAMSLQTLLQAAEPDGTARGSFAAVASTRDQ